jgi:DNA-binding CsgD family transcriptional regulator
LRTFSEAARMACRLKLGQADAAGWSSVLQRLATVKYGGIARMLEALPLNATAAEGYSALTPTEREILQLLAQGASSKEAAIKTGRSPQTIDTHIRAICRKLGCSGRREAVALATSSGWVHI